MKRGRSFCMVEGNLGYRSDRCIDRSGMDGAEDLSFSGHCGAEPLCIRSKAPFDTERMYDGQG